MTGGMSDWREDDDLESFEAELERAKLSPEGIAETNRHLVERQALFRRAADVATATWHLFDRGCHYRNFRPVGVLPSNVKSAANSAPQVSDGTRPSRARKQG